MDIEKIYSEIKETAINGIEGIDGKKEWSRKKWETEPGIFDISVYRGKAIEKASLARISLEVKKTIAGPGETLNIMNLDGFQINIFPSNPLLPVAMFNLERRQLAGGIRLGGYISIFSMKDNKGIIGNIKDTFSLTVKKIGKEESQVLKEYGVLWQDLDWHFKGENGIGIKISGEDKDLENMKNAVILLLASYLDCIRNNKNIKFSAEDEKQMFSFRFKLSEFVLIKDPSTKLCFEKGVPLETLSSMILPPVVKF